MTYADTDSATSSPGLADGAPDCDLLAGPTTDLFGQEVARVSRFSAAGAQRGSDDDRHLWPAWFRLVSECGPRIVFGEQVAGAAGAAWWDHVAADLESAGYAAAAANLGAHSVGAPHIRQRLYWVAHGWRQGAGDEKERPGLADDGWMGEPEAARLQEREGPRALGKVPPSGPEQASHWGRCDWIRCSDGKSRPVEPGTFPLAYGVRNRVGRLRAYGNAIVPQVAAVFVMANV